MSWWKCFALENSLVNMLSCSMGYRWGLWNHVDNNLLSKPVIPHDNTIRDDVLYSGHMNQHPRSFDTTANWAGHPGLHYWDYNPGALSSNQVTETITWTMLTKFHEGIWQYQGPGANKLTHWGRDKMATISQTTFLCIFLNFSWEFQLKFHCSLFLMFELRFVPYVRIEDIPALV